MGLSTTYHQIYFYSGLPSWLAAFGWKGQKKCTNCVVEFSNSLHRSLSPEKIFSHFYLSLYDDVYFAKNGKVYLNYYCKWREVFFKYVQHCFKSTIRFKMSSSIAWKVSICLIHWPSIVHWQFYSVHKLPAMVLKGKYNWILWCLEGTCCYCFYHIL